MTRLFVLNSFRYPWVPRCRRVVLSAVGLLALAHALPPYLVASGEDRRSPEALEVIQRSVEAMGGQAYLDVRAVESSGRYFTFRRGRKGFTRYTDWTSFKPVKWRFQLGEGKGQYIQVYNLEEGKGWTLEGKDDLKEVPPEAVEEFRRDTKLDIDLVLRFRKDEEGMNLFYYGPDEVAGSGQYEAVEFLDSTNASVVVFFDLRSHLPMKSEFYQTDKEGVRHKHEVEYITWKTIQGVEVPLRYDSYVDGEISSQRFLQQIILNPEIPAERFSKPVIEVKD